MAKNEEHQDWLDAAFDDAQAQADMDKARRSRNRGCLICALVVIVALIIVAVVGCGMLGSIFYG